jgi:putative transposase
VQLTSHANAWAESFMKTLKAEEVDGRRYRNLDDATTSIATFIDQLYNPQRLHSALNYLSPMEFEADIACNGAPIVSATAKTSGGVEVGR